MTVPDPKSFYNETMPRRTRGAYERARWRANPLLSAQYRMLSDTLARFVLPDARRARRILEVGPGPGTWTKLVLESNPGARYTLVDISGEMLAQAKENLEDYTNIVFHESDILSFEASEKYDFFFSSRAIEYMPDKRAAARKNTSLLAPGGRGVLITKMPKPFFDFIRGRAPRALHGAQIGPTALTRLMREEGIIVENIRIATVTVPLIGSALLNEWAYALLRSFPLFFPCMLFAESYLITFRKPI